MLMALTMSEREAASGMALRTSAHQAFHFTQERESEEFYRLNACSNNEVGLDGSIEQR